MIRESTNQHQLPKGWVWSNLSTVSKDIYRYPTFYGMEHLATGVPVIRGEHILEKGNISHDWVNYWFVLPEVSHKFSRTIVETGDLIMSVRGSIGKVGLVDEPLQNAQVSPNCIKISLHKNQYMPRLLFYYLKSSTGQESVKELINATTIQTIKAGLLSQIPIPFPPLPEQHRITAKIEELFTRLDAGIDALNKIKLQLKRYRQSVLKSAFEGKLTKDWRVVHKGELEPASVLLEKIKAEQEKSGKYKELPPLDTSKLPVLPDEWVWVRIGDVTDDVEKVSPRTKPEKEFLYLDIASIDNSQQKIICPKTYLGKEAPSRARQLVNAGDILFSTVRTYLRNIAVVDENYSGQIASTGFCVIRPSHLTTTKFIFYCIQADDFLNPLTELQRGTSYPAVRDSDVLSQPIPFLPVREQQEIAKEIERCFSVADNIERTLEQSLTQSERLRQSILKNAFEGKLVPQDPNDEPAEKLLERIKTEKARQQASVMATRGRNKRNLNQGRLI